MIHRVFTNDITALEVALPLSPGFVEFTDLNPFEEETEEQIDRTDLILSYENGSNVTFNSIGLLEIRGCIRRLHVTDVKKMTTVIEDALDRRTVFLMKELSHIKNEDNEGYGTGGIGRSFGVLIGVHPLGNEFRILQLLHENNEDGFDSNGNEVDQPSEDRGE